MILYRLLQFTNLKSNLGQILLLMKNLSESKLFSLTTLLAILFIGCKREQIKTITRPDNTKLEKARLFVKKQIEQEGGLSQRIELNQRMNVAYTDLKGNIVDNPFANFRIQSVCNDDFPDYVDITAYSRLYTCGVGYKIQFFWTISWNNKIVLVNPYNSSNKTKGVIKVSIPGNSNAYSNTTEDVEIYDMGTDPNNSSNNIYVVKMTSSTLVPVDLVNTSGAVLRLGGYFASDCSSLDMYSLAPMSVTGFGYETPLNSDPCTRNDKAWFIPPGAYSSNQIGVWGYDPLGVCPSYDAGAAPSYQSVDYSLDGGLSWNPFSNVTSINSNIITTTFVSRTDMAVSSTLASGTYNVLIRYVNTKLNSGVPGNTKPTSSINSCITGGWGTETYTFESFSNIVIP